MGILEIKSVKDLYGFEQLEIELCCMISNRFTDGDLFNAGHHVNNYKKGMDFIIPDDIKEFISELDVNQRPVRD